MGRTTLISAIIASIVVGRTTAQQALAKAEGIYQACKSIDVVYTFREQRRTHRVHVLIVKNAGWAAEVLSSELFTKGYWAYRKNGQPGFIVHPRGTKCNLNSIALAVDHYLVAGVSSLTHYSGVGQPLTPKDFSKAVFGTEKSWQGKPAVQILVDESGRKFSYYLNADYTRILGVKNSVSSKGPQEYEIDESSSFDNQKLDAATSKDLDAWIVRAEKLVKPENRKH